MFSWSRIESLQNTAGDSRDSLDHWSRAEMAVMQLLPEGPGEGWLTRCPARLASLCVLISDTLHTLLRNGGHEERG